MFFEILFFEFLKKWKHTNFRLKIWALYWPYYYDQDMKKIIFEYLKCFYNYKAPFLAISVSSTNQTTSKKTFFLLFEKIFRQNPIFARGKETNNYCLKVVLFWKLRVFLFFWDISIFFWILVIPARLIFVWGVLCYLKTHCFGQNPDKRNDFKYRLQKTTNFVCGTVWSPPIFSRELFHMTKAAAQTQPGWKMDIPKRSPNREQNCPNVT